MPALPVLGNVHQIASTQTHTLLESWDRAHGPLVRFRIFGREVLAISDLELVLEFFKRRPEAFRRTRNIEKVITELGAHGVFDAEGDDWRRQSRLVKGAFSRKSIQASLGVLDLVTQRLVQSWKPHSGTTLDLRVPLTCFTADVTTLLAFGYDLNTVERQSDVQAQIQTIFDAIGRRLTAPFSYWRYLPLPRDRAVTRAVRSLQPLVLDVIARAKSEEPTRQTLLAGMLEAREREDFSDQDVYGNVLTLLLAGEDTTANGLAWALYYLALHPHWQTQIRDEATSVLGERITPEHISELSGLRAAEAVFKEALRLRSPAPFVFFEPTEDTEVRGLKLRKGQIVVALTRRIAMNEKHFSEPERFMPERWLQKRSEGWNHNLKAALAFGSGPRTCPGAQLSVLEAQVLLAAICRNFDLRFDGSDEDIEEIFSFVMHPKSMPIRITTRTPART